MSFDNHYLLFITSNNFNRVTVTNKKAYKGSISFYNLRGNLLLKEIINSEFAEFTLNENGIVLYLFEASKGENKLGKLLVK